MENVTFKYLNLLTDYAFKRIFGSEACKDLLIDFLNELIEDQGRIINLRYLPTEHLGRQEEDRRAVFDIYCQTDCNKFFIVELQKVRQAYFKDRSIYYSSFPVQSQAVRGIWNFNLHPVYTVAILDFVLFEEESESNFYYHTVKLKNEKTNKVFFDKLVYKYLELPKFKKSLSELETNFERWIYLLKNLPVLEKRPPELRGKIFDKLFEFAVIEQLTITEMEEYRKSILDYDDIKDAIKYAEERAEEKAMKRAEEKAMEKAEEKAMEKVKMAMKEAEEAMEERIEKERKELVLRCLSKGLSPDTIVELTGLDKEQINAWISDTRI